MAGHRMVSRQSQWIVFFAGVACWLLLVGITAPLANAQVTGDSRWPGLNPVVPEPSFPALCTQIVGSNGEPAGVLYANQVTGDITQEIDPRLQNAINTCQPAAGQPAVGLELSVSGSNNAFVIGPTILQPGVTLIVDAGVTVFASTAQGYTNGVINVATNTGATATAYTGGAMGYWGIMGYGILDGQGAGQLVRLIQMGSGPSNASDYFTLYKITLQNGGQMHVIGVSNNFLAYDVKIATAADSANTDGIDPSGSNNVTIVNSFLSDGDDHIAIKAGVAPVTNVTIAHNHLYAGHGMSVGSETNAGLNNLLVTDMTIDNNGAFGSGSRNSLRIKSDDSRGGTVQNVLYDGVCIQNGGHVFIFDPYYGSAVGNSSGLYPNFKNITLQDVNVVNADQTAHSGASALRGYDYNKIVNPLIMTLDNVVLSPSNNLANLFPLSTGPLSSEYGLADAVFTLGPDPFTGAALFESYSGEDNITVINDISNDNPAYDCSSKFTYLARELFGQATTVDIGSTVTLTAIVQPTVGNTWAATPAYVPPAPTGAITIYDNGTQVASQTVTPPAASYTCPGHTSICSLPRSLTNISLPNVSAGTHVYTAAYSGDSYYLPANNTSGIVATGGAGGGLIPAAPQFPSFTVQATGTGTITPVTPSVTAASKAYDGSTAASVTCTLTPAVANVTCTVPVASFASVNVGTGITVTATGIYLSGSAAGNYQLSSTAATTVANIIPATPTLTLKCTEVTYDGNAHSCTGSATGAEGVAVSGTWSYSPASATAAGSYAVTGTFTSGNANYTNGTATGLLVIDPAGAGSVLTPRVIPYMTSVFAGIPGQSTGTAPYAVGAACTNGSTSSGNTAVDKYGDGCLATEAVLYMTYAIVFDSAGNAYIADADAAGFSFVRKVDAVTGVISMFAGGLSATVSPSPCASYSDGVHPAGPDPMIAAIVNNGASMGDGCPATDPVTGVSYSYLKGIRDLAIDANWLYIDDSSNSKIRRVSLSSSPAPYHQYAHELEPIAGSGSSGWSADGSTGNLTQIKNPYSVTVGPKGDVYFGDQSGNSIRRVTPTTYTPGSNGVAVANIGTVSTVLNCAASGSTCVIPVANSACPSGSPGGASRNIKTYSATGMAFDAGGNMYYAAQHCYSVYKIAANSAGVVDGSTSVTTLIGTGGESYSYSDWIPAFATTSIAIEARYVTSAGGNNMYLIDDGDAWLYDASDTANGAGKGWLYQFWGSSFTGLGCTGSVGTSSYFGCPAPYSTFSGETTGGKGSMDPAGNLYVADGGDSVVLKAATGLDFIGTGPQVQVDVPVQQAMFIHGVGISDADVAFNASSPFSLTPAYTLSDYTYQFEHCFTYSGVQNDGGTDCTYVVTYNPSAAGLQTGTLSANATNLTAEGFGAAPSATPVVVTCGSFAKIYGQPDPTFTSGAFPAVGSWSVAPVCAVAGETGAGVFPINVINCSSLVAAGQGPFSCAAGLMNVSPAFPVLGVTCPEVPYDGNPHSCTAAATGLNGAVVAGSFRLSPASKTAPGSYTVTAQFTSGDSNYYGGGEAIGSLKIDPAIPVVTVTCPAAIWDGTPHGGCTATAIGVAGASVSGTFTFAPAVETAVGSYPVTATFTSGDPNYANAFGSGTLVIKASATGTVSATFSATSVVFANPIMLGQSAPAQYVMIRSTGTAPLLVSGVTVGGANPGDFLVSNQAGTCTTGASLIYYANCNLRIVFTPTATGPRSATLYFNGNLAGAPLQVTVSGTAVSGAQLSLSATSLTFPATAVGATAATQYLTLKSTGFEPVVISKVTLGAGDFDLSDQAGTCTTAATTSLVPGASCNIRVKFHPIASGSRSATVTINDNTAASSHTVTLNGTGQ